MLRSTLTRRTALVGAAALIATGTTALAAPTAQAAKGGSCAGYTVLIGGQALAGDVRTTVPADQVGATIEVVGTFNHFTVDAATFAVHDYTATGVSSSRPDKDLPLDGPTVIFTDKIPQHGATLDSAVDVRVTDEHVRLQRSGGGQDMKIQAKDCPAGGLFQMEPEPGTTIVHRLGPTFRYNGPAGDGRLCFTDGAAIGYDSPELATRLSPLDGQGTESTWQVAAGGRMGMVTGEDAAEGGCTP